MKVVLLFIAITILGCKSDFNFNGIKLQIEKRKLSNGIEVIFEPNKTKMLTLASKGFVTATDLADHLVRHHNKSFRKAYQITTSIVNYAEREKIKLNELSLKDLQKIEPSLKSNVLNIFDLKNSINSKKSFGGTSFNNIKKMIVKYKKIYK